MRVVLQRVTRARVRVGDEEVGSIGPGVLLFVGVARDDDVTTAQRLARKCAELRVLRDAEGRFERSLADVDGEALVVSQFTLMADVRRGRRPAFLDAAPPEIAAPLVEALADELRRLGVTVATGRFGATMEVELVNDGPVTIVIDSADLERPRKH